MKYYRPLPHQLFVLHQAFLRRRASSRPKPPADSIPSVAGSGTAVLGPALNRVVTDNNSTLSIYLDGVLKNSTSIPSKNYLSGLSDTLAYIGKSVYAGDPGFAGSINEFDIYNNALSAADVTICWPWGEFHGTHFLWPGLRTRQYCDACIRSESLSTIVP